MRSWRCAIALLGRIFDGFDGERDHAGFTLVVMLDELLTGSPDTPGHRQIKLCCDALEGFDDVLVHPEPKTAIVRFLFGHDAILLHSTWYVKVTLKMFSKALQMSICNS